jgi:hypothetical protein
MPTNKIADAAQNAFSETINMLPFFILGVICFIFGIYFLFKK